MRDEISDPRGGNEDLSRPAYSYNARVKEYLCKKSAWETGCEKPGKDDAEEPYEKSPGQCCIRSFLYGILRFSPHPAPRTENRRLSVLRDFLLSRYPQTGEKPEEPACEYCTRWLLRGAFLACACVSDPKKEYHLEFHVSDEEREEELLALLRGFEITGKVTARRARRAVYIKNSDQIADVLTVIGAQPFTLEMIQNKIYRDIRNRVNRSNNCDSANMNKTVQAACEMKRAVQRLKKQGKFTQLPEELQQAAQLRIEHPELSLAQLCGLMEEPISKSGLNHRFLKILELAKGKETSQP